MSEVIRKKAPIGLRVRRAFHTVARRKYHRVPVSAPIPARMVPVPLNPQVLVVNATTEQLSASAKFADEFNRNYKPEEGAPLFVEA